MEAPEERETLAGHHGRCKDYKKASGLGNHGSPFTWLSEDGTAEASKALSERLAAVKRSGSQLPFEAWELHEDGWRLVCDGPVRVLYVELCGHGQEVRTLLQWARDGRSADPAPRPDR